MMLRFRFSMASTKLLVVWHPQVGNVKRKDLAID
jgi:hypothetical protein